MHDLRSALRALVSTPIVSLVAVVSLALGIGANTAIFSILDSLLLRSLPVGEPARLVQVWQGPSEATTYPVWDEIRRRPEQFGGFAAWGTARFDLAQTGQTDMVDGLWASGRLFDVLRVPAIVGRTLRDDDDRRGGGPEGPVAVISYAFWQRRFGGAADVVGKTLTLNRVQVPFRIIGVTAAGFFGPVVGRSYDVAIPIGAEPLFNPGESALDSRSSWWLRLVGRLAPGQTIESLTSALRDVQPRIREATLPPLYSKEELLGYLREPFSLQPAATGVSSLRARYQRPLVVLMVIVAMVLVVACANVANLQLARAEARRHELSVRRALGASRFRLARQLLTESLLLSVAGAALGLVVARWGSRLLVSQFSTSVSTAFLDLPLDWRLLGFATGVAVATAVLFGTVPALRAARSDANEALRDGRGSIGSGRRVVGHTLVVAQIGLSLALVVAAGLFVRSFASLATLDTGFDTDRLLAVRVTAPPGAVAPDAAVAFFDRVRDAAASVPGVERVAVSTLVPLGGSTTAYRIEVPEGPPLAPSNRLVSVNFVGPGWFDAFGTPLIAGRDFGAQDRTGAPLVIIVNQKLARRFFGGQSPLGRQVRIQGGGFTSVADIVGVVGDAVYRDLREPLPPTMYIPVTQFARQSHHQMASAISVLLRSASGSPAAIAPGVVAAITKLDPTLSLSVRTVRDQVDAALTQERLVAMLAGFFGVLALLLAGIGVYGVTAYGVHRRRTELGLRMALGAAPAGVLRLVLRRVALLTGLGVLAGGAASFWAARFVGGLLYGLEPRDPSTFAAAAAVLALVGLLAGAIPAWRAARVDPSVVLRCG
jgi:predicted permease